MGCAVSKVRAAHLFSLSRKDDEGREQECDKRERGDGRQEATLVEVLRFEEREDAASEKSGGEGDACAARMLATCPR